MDRAKIFVLASVAIVYLAILVVTIIFIITNPATATVTVYTPQTEIAYEIIEVEVEKIVEVPAEIKESLGVFEVTYYTAGQESTGKSKGHPAYGITRSGATVWEGVTVAVDPTVIPLGTYLYIEGIGFRVAQDTGGAIKGNKIDIYVTDVKRAISGGRHKAEVYRIGENSEE